ncbi:beta-1,6-N-acetylglucosaminyltransferase [Flavobacterium sp. B17]|uniref:beta-1,6-N-acetylglucosaminyltransferase n=1 Tax=Flavobacterium sp. B17 TaxID=95618 RepID=UPI000A2ED8BA|nr:beta-1,6-N-acetylglucosaminyltransferase [Flavobacterium sp. B17]
MQAYTPDTYVQTEPLAALAGSPVKIAYFIMVHHEAEKFKKLFQKIYTRDQVYLIHIDRKSKDGFTEEIQQFIIQFPNAYILESMNINPGGFSIIQTQINAMEFLLNVSDDWDFFINLSVEDQPLKSQKIIRKFLGQNRNKNYLFYYDQKFYRPDTLQRIQNHFTELAYKISSLIYKREFMKDVVPYIGGKWVIFTRETCRFFSSNDKVMLFEDFYLHTFLPGDSFFQTVLMNTDFREIIVNDDKRAVSGSCRNSGELIQELKNNSQLFIRMLDPATDKDIFTYIEESYDLPLPEIDEVARELKINRHQDN